MSVHRWSDPAQVTHTGTPTFDLSLTELSLGPFTDSRFTLLLYPVFNGRDVHDRVLKNFDPVRMATEPLPGTYGSRTGSSDRAGAAVVKH